MHEINVQRQYLKSFVDGILAINDSSILSVTEAGVKTLCTDAAHVAMVEATLERDACEDFQVTEPSTYGIDLEQFRDLFLKNGAPSDTLRLSFAEDAKNLTVSYPITKRGDRAVMTMGLLEQQGMPSFKRPKFELLGKFTANTETFFAAVEVAGKISDHVAIIHEDSKVTLSATMSDDKGHVEVPIGFAYAGPAQKFQCLFPTDYLSNMARTLKGYKQVKVQFDSDKPIIFTAKTLTEQGRLAVTMEYILAPRIEND